MATKLTLSVNGQTVRRAKSYAKKHKTSVSKIVESYLASLPEENCKIKLTGVVAELAGILSNPTNDYEQHIEHKYQ